MKFNLQKIREARDYAELLANLNGLETEIRKRKEKLDPFKILDASEFYFIRELLGDDK